MTLYSILFVFIQGCASGKLSKHQKQQFIDHVNEIQTILSNPGLNIQGIASIHYIKPCIISVESISNNLEKELIFHRSKVILDLSKYYRNIEYVPAHVVRYEGGANIWSDVVQISFNKDLKLLIENRFINSDKTVESLDSSDVQLSISLPYDPVLFSSFLHRFKQMAMICGAEISNLSTVKGKLQGVWSLWGRDQYSGELVFQRDLVKYTGDFNKIIFSGKYQLKTFNFEHFLVLDSELMPDDMKYMRINFFSSNSAELFLLGPDKQQIGSFIDDDSKLYQLSRISD